LLQQATHTAAAAAADDDDCSIVHSHQQQRYCWCASTAITSIRTSGDKIRLTSNRTQSYYDSRD